MPRQKNLAALASLTGKKVIHLSVFARPKLCPVASLPGKEAMPCSAFAKAWRLGMKQNVRAGAMFINKQIENPEIQPTGPLALAGTVVAAPAVGLVKMNQLPWIPKNQNADGGNGVAPWPIERNFGLARSSLRRS